MRQNSTRTGAFVALATICAVLLQAASAQIHQHGHHQQPISGHQQQQVDAGKIISSGSTASGLSSIGRPARHVHGEVQFFDLSHPLNNATLHWPTNKGFRSSMDVDGERLDPNGKPYHLRSDSINMATHAGTHLDAPSHFSKSSWSVEQIPLDRLIDVPLTVLDLSAKVQANRSYSFLVSDFQTKDNQSLVMGKSVVLVYTGISEFYKDGYKGYIGTEMNGTAVLQSMKSPGFSAEAANYLVKQGVYGVGLDAISADSSERQVKPEFDPVAHVEFNKNNVYILENVSNKLKELIGKQSPRITIAPLPIVNGTGSPVRLVAIVGHDECEANVPNGASGKSSMLLGLANLVLIIFGTLAFIL